DLGWGNRTVAAQYNSLVGENTLASAQFSYSEYQSLTEAEIFSTPFQVDNRLEEISVKADLTAKLGDSHTLKGGLQASRYKFTYFQEFDDDASLDFESKPTDVTAYAEDEWRYENSTITRLGLRTRYFSEGDRILVEPRLSVNRRLTDRLRLKVGAGIYYQYLQLVATEGFAAGDFYFPVDETAEPGRSIQAVSGLTYDFNDQYQVSGEVYYTDLARLLIFDNNATFEQEDINTDTLFLTKGEGYATGLELFAQKRTGRLRGWVGYTLGWTRRTFDELNDGKTFPPKYDRRHDINVVASYESGPWTYGASFVYGTGQAFTPAAAKYQLRDPILGDDNEGGFVLPADRNSARLLPYHRLDVSVRKKFGLFGSQAEWFIQVFNLYSRRNEWFVQFDSSDPTNEPEIVRQLPVIPTIGVNFAF
ncbi:MAG: TonB-dependent receptor, partial [Candidatus Eisenbacteria bacterium]|nr:TonB-dependent receptor [Candidatus Eisenbacteria bacterium]